MPMRYAFRTLLKNPGFALAAILTLALGIGANTTIFSVVNGILLRALPYPDASRLVVVWETAKRDTVERRSASYPDFEDWQRQSDAFTGMGLTLSTGLTLAGDDRAERLPAELVSTGYLATLGVPPALGRTLQTADDTATGAVPIVISHALWQRRFAGATDVAGRTVQLDDQLCTIVGVMPAGFRGLSGDAEVWVPVDSPFFSKTALTRRGQRTFQVVARLKAGTTIPQAQASLDTIASRLAREYPDTNANRGVQVVSLRNQLFGDMRPALLVLFGAVGLVLLIACANVANLLLARASGRRKELAIRLALGASRGQVLRQLLTESLALSLVGGLAGALLAIWGVTGVTALNPIALPAFVHIGVDPLALLFTLAVSLLSGLVFGLWPGWRASAPDLTRTLKEGGPAGGPEASRRLASRTLVAAEIALALVLLIGAGLLLRSLHGLQEFDPGFQPDRLLTMRLQLPAGQYPPPAMAAFSQQLLASVQALPGVSRATLASDVPLTNDYSATFARIEGRTYHDDGIRIYVHRVGPEFFRTIGTPLVAGRGFTTDDAYRSDRTGVVVISQAMARRYWTGRSPIGDRLRVGGYTFTIVGIARDVKYRTLLESDAADPDVYFPLFGIPTSNFALVLRSDVPPAALVRSVRARVRALNPAVPVYAVTPVSDLFADQTARARFSAWLLAVFALLALLLAAVGVYGVLAHLVTQQTRQIGIRMALGARRGDVLRLVLRQGAVAVVAGLAVGLLVALGLARLLGSLLYGVSATDPFTYVGVSALLATVAFIACCLPALRATRVDPVVALKDE